MGMSLNERGMSSTMFESFECCHLKRPTDATAKSRNSDNVPYFPPGFCPFWITYNINPIGSLQDPTSLDPFNPSNMDREGHSFTTGLM